MVGRRLPNSETRWLCSHIILRTGTQKQVEVATFAGWGHGSRGSTSSCLASSRHDLQHVMATGCDCATSRRLTRHFLQTLCRQTPHARWEAPIDNVAAFLVHTQHGCCRFDRDDLCLDLDSRRMAFGGDAVESPRSTPSSSSSARPTPESSSS
jgi:hypothetical protein